MNKQGLLKLLVAFLMVASFAITSVNVQAGEKGQKKKVEVRGWDPEKKSAVEGKKKALKAEKKAARKKDCTAPTKNKKKDKKKGNKRVSLGDLPCG